LSFVGSFRTHNQFFEKFQKPGNSCLFYSDFFFKKALRTDGSLILKIFQNLEPKVITKSKNRATRVASTYFHINFLWGKYINDHNYPQSNIYIFKGKALCIWIAFLVGRI
jgi:hypothetical protein